MTELSFFFFFAPPTANQLGSSRQEINLHPPFFSPPRYLQQTSPGWIKKSLRFIVPFDQTQEMAQNTFTLPERAPSVSPSEGAMAR